MAFVAGCRNPPWGRTTTKGKTLYLHVFDWPAERSLQVDGLTTPVRKAYLLHDPQRTALKCTRSVEGRLAIDLSGCQPYQYASVIAVELQ